MCACVCVCVKMNEISQLILTFYYFSQVSGMSLMQLNKRKILSENCLNSDINIVLNDKRRIEKNISVF